MEYKEILENEKLTRDEFLPTWEKFKADLNKGKIRVAEKVDGTWVVNKWVKQIILLGMKHGVIKKFEDGTVDKDTLGNRYFEVEEKVRVTSPTVCVRDGAYIATSVCLMAPCYVNIGAYIDEGAMIDSLALVGSCAQIGKKVHIGAGAIIGGVLEPVGMVPVIVEDNAFIGAGAKITEGAIIRQNAIIGAGVTITASTPIYDVINNKIIKANENGQVIVPEGAVVVPGAREIDRGNFNERLSVTTPIIIKYGTQITLEELLR